MSKLNINPYDNARVMSMLTELLEDILGRAISELEQPEKIIDDARRVVDAMRSPVASPNQAA
jgi:hypothetical protein